MPGTTAIAPGAGPRPGRRRASPVLRAEWIKLSTIRSAPCTLAGAAVLIVAVSALVTSSSTKGGAAGLDPTSASLGGVLVGEYLFAVFGALAVSTEYSSGTMAATLCAVPQRGRVLLAKLCVVAAVAAIWAAVSCLGSFGLGQAILARHGLQVSPGDPSAAGALVRAVLLLALMAVLGAALAMLLRRTAGVLIVMLVLLYVAVPLAALLLRPGSTLSYLAWLLPSFATKQALASKPMSAYALHVHAPGPLSGLLVFAVMVALTAAVAAAVFRRRGA